MHVRCLLTRVRHTCLHGMHWAGVRLAEYCMGGGPFVCTSDITCYNVITTVPMHPATHNLPTEAAH